MKRNHPNQLQTCIAGIYMNGGFVVSNGKASNHQRRIGSIST